VDKQAVLELIALQQRSGFADVLGSEGQATLRVTDRLLNQIVTAELRHSRVLRELNIQPLDRDRFAVRFALAKPSFLPPFTIGVVIERQPAMPNDPVLVLKLEGAGGLMRFTGPAAAFLNVLPPGVRMFGDRVHVDIGALLQQRGLGAVVQYVDDLRVNTEPGAVRIGFRARLG
jgi:hypothetical protein